MVSFSVSPLEELVVEASWNPITRPPRRLTAFHFVYNLSFLQKYKKSGD